MEKLLLICLLSLVTYCLSSIYVSAFRGSDNNDGSLSKPFATFSKAHQSAKSGDTIFFFEGVYNEISGIHKNLSLVGISEKKPIFSGPLTVWSEKFEMNNFVINSFTGGIEIIKKDHANYKLTNLEFKSVRGKKINFKNFR
jgi:hypothetical protein